MRWLSRTLAVAILVLSLGLSLGCPGELPRNDGKASPSAEPAPSWPDLPPTQSDLPATTPPPDGYVSTPFGCRSDQDCFGQVCCPTAWGVHLCSPTCTP